MFLNTEKLSYLHTKKPKSNVFTCYFNNKVNLFYILYIFTCSDISAYIKRVIAHPNFHNIGYKECEKILTNMDQGECIIRPSSKVCNCTLSLIHNLAVTNQKPMTHLMRFCSCKMQLLPTKDGNEILSQAGLTKDFFVE